MYLMIRNAGVVDHRSLTLIGASCTRFSNRPGTIGQFGSGFKLSIALLLRLGIRPVVTAGNLKMEFFSKPEYVNGQTFNRVCVKYSGKDIDGTSKTSTDDLGFVLEWGVQDWNRPSMALREFVSNAIDGSIENGSDYTGVEFEIVPQPRAKNGHTAVFLPYTEEVEKMYRQVGTMFLHFGAPDLLKSKLLPKREPSVDKVLIYKKGVLVAYVPGKSVFDYNLGDELTLDESRNANEWDVKYAVAQALKDATPEQLASILTAVLKDKDTWEGKLDSSYLTTSDYGDGTVKARRKETFQKAWKAVAGEKGVVTSGKTALNSFVAEKGYDPVTVPSPQWAAVLESYDVPTETKVLSKNEQEGKVITDASADMLASVDKIWGLFTAFNLTNGKDKPGAKAFYTIMEGSSQTWGYYVPGDTDVHLHRDLTAGPFLDKVTLEEVTHYVTGADDKSRDIQDFLFRMIVAMAF
jgi:hypothetical protein